MYFRYTAWDEQRHGEQLPAFDRLMDIFQQLLQHTAGDASEASRLLREHIHVPQRALEESAPQRLARGAR